DQVVRRDGVRRVGQRDGLHRAAFAPQRGDAGADRLLHLGIEAFAEILLGDADGQAAHRLLQLRVVVGHRPQAGGLIARVATSAAGCRMEPPVSVPSAPGTKRAATAAAEPPDEPPGVRSRSQGLRVGPYALFSVDEPIANSSMFTLPTRTAPASRSLRTTVASYGGTYPSRMRDPAVVSTPSWQNRSLRPTGTPSHGESGALRGR